VQMLIVGLWCLVAVERQCPVTDRDGIAVASLYPFLSLPATTA
jgi:hypothetical protein